MHRETIFFIVCLLVIYYNYEEYENYKESLITRKLETDGFCVLYDPLYSLKTKDKPCEELESDVLQILPEGYMFIDYIYKINNVSLARFHRDVTSSKHTFKTKHTVYTLILYKYDGDLLSVCPGSNETYPFTWSRILNIDGKNGTAFLFDCDLLHAGRVNKCKDRNVIQYKICHIDDLDTLQSLHGVRAEKTEKCINTVHGKIERKLSYFFEMPINYFMYPLMIKRETSNSLVGKIQSYIPLGYYNNV
jgi:hypothetical protein